MALRPSASLSGGEKARLVLALIAWQQPALLLLDEPTNHLDIEMRHALTVALQDYEGAMVIVSHDRDLLGRCVDEFWLVRPAESSRTTMISNTTPSGSGNASRRSRSNAPPNRRERRQAAATHRRQTQELRNIIRRLEASIESTTNSVKALDATLADPVTYETMSTQHLQTLIAQRTALVRELSAAEGDWLRKHEELDAAVAATRRDADLDPGRRRVTLQPVAGLA